jgi:hypothetical protein
VSEPLGLHFVRLKRGTEGKAGSSSTITQTLFWKESLRRGSLARELEFLATHRLGVNLES